MRYKAILRYEDGRSYVEQSDKLNVAEHFYDCFVENGIRSGQGFYVSLMYNGYEKMSFNGWHTA